MTSINLTKQQKQSIMAEYSAKMNTKKQGSKTPARSRSRSRSRPRTLNTVAKKRAKSQRQTHRELQSHIRMNIMPVHQKLQQMRRKMDGIKQGYFVIDNKDSKNDTAASTQAQIDLLQKEFDMLKNTFRAGLKDRPIKMQLSTSFVITTTVTTGVTNTININAGGTGKLLPSDCTEWSSISALFDEYKCFGGRVVFNYYNPVAADTTVTNLTSDSLPIIGYDGGDTAAATSSLAMTQLSEHKILDAIFVETYGGSGATPNMVGPASSLRHDFKWHVPKGVVMGASGAIPGTQWIPTTAVTGAGYLKFYHVGQSITAKNTGAGIILFDLEFRCRE